MAGQGVVSTYACAAPGKPEAAAPEVVASWPNAVCLRRSSATMRSPAAPDLTGRVNRHAPRPGNSRPYASAAGHAERFPAARRAVRKPRVHGVTHEGRFGQYEAMPSPSLTKRDRQ